jgi:hypothetical protein
MSDKLIVAKEIADELGLANDSDLIKKLLESEKDRKPQEIIHRNYYTPEQARKTITPVAKTHSQEGIYRNKYNI